MYYLFLPAALPANLLGLLRMSG